jgi:hypothetical protein
MAEHLGSALASESGAAKSFSDRSHDTLKHLLKAEHLSLPYTSSLMEAANIPDKGAMVMYNYLMGLNEETNKHWPLQKREDTPFSDQNMRRFSRSSQMAGNTILFEEDVMAELRAPEKLSVRDRRISIDIAHEILEKLRNLTANPETQERTNHFSDDKQEKNKLLLQLATGFRDAMAVLSDAVPDEIQNNKILAKAIGAFEQLGYRMKADTYKALGQEYEMHAAGMFKADLDKTQDKYKSDDKSTDSLLADVESGLREAKLAQERNAVRIAQREAQRAARRAARNVQQNQQVFAGGAVREVNRRGRGALEAARRSAREQARALKDQERKDAPLLNPEGSRTR